MQNNSIYHAPPVSYSVPDSSDRHIAHRMVVVGEGVLSGEEEKAGLLCFPLPLVLLRALYAHMVSFIFMLDLENFH